MPRIDAGNSRPDVGVGVGSGVGVGVAVGRGVAVLDCDGVVVPVGVVVDEALGDTETDGWIVGLDLG